MLDNFIYNIANTKSYGHVMININDWINTSNIEQINIRGRAIPTSITKVLKVNVAPAYRNPVMLEEGDIIALSSIATRVGILKSFKIPNDNNDYANVHISQILGKFSKGIVSLDTFTPLYDKVLLKRINVSVNDFIYIENDDIEVCEVIKTGNGGFDKDWNRRDMKVKQGDIVLVRDNVTSYIRLDGEDYYVVDDSFIVGTFSNTGKQPKGNYNIEYLSPLPNTHVFREYSEETLEGSFLYKPQVDIDDITELYKNNVYELICSDSLSKGVYMIERCNLEYIKFKGETYFVCNTLDNIMCKKEREYAN